MTPFHVEGVACFTALALACTSLEPSGQPFTSPIVLEGVRMALECGRRHDLPIKHPPETLRYYVSSDLRTADWVEGTRIWVDRRLAGEVRVFAHAQLHALYDLPGGPTTPHPAIFSECDLWPI